MSTGCHSDCFQATPRNLKVLVQNPWHWWLGGALTQEAPSLVILQALEVATPANMTPLCVNVGATKRVYHCWVVGCHDGPSISHVAICTFVHNDHLGMKLLCPFCLQTFLNSDALRWHKRQVHTLGSPNPH